MRLLVVLLLSGCATTSQLLAQGRLEDACRRDDGALAQWLVDHDYAPRWRRVPRAEVAAHGVDAGADYGDLYVVVEEFPLDPTLPFQRTDDGPEVEEQRQYGSRFLDVSGEPDAWNRLRAGHRYAAPEDGAPRQSGNLLALGVLGTLVPVLPFMSVVTGRDLISPLVNTPTPTHVDPPRPGAPTSIVGRTARLLARVRGERAREALMLVARPRFQFGACRYRVQTEVLVLTTDDPAEALDARPTGGFWCQPRQRPDVEATCLGTQRGPRPQ